MGSSKRRHSTARRERGPAKHSHKPRRKSSGPKPSNAAQVTMAAVAQPPISDGVPTTELRRIRNRLDIASAVAYLCAAALKAQTADNDLDVALILRSCCGDVLFGPMQQINRLLGEDDDEDDGDGDDGDDSDDEVGGAL